METEYNPASDPMNGPNRLSLQRTPEARRYDQTDWPGSSSFHPRHINDLFRNMGKQAVEVSEPEQSFQPELPFEEE